MYHDDQVKFKLNLQRFSLTCFLGPEPTCPPKSKFSLRKLIDKESPSNLESNSTGTSYFCLQYILVSPTPFMICPPSPTACVVTCTPRMYTQFFQFKLTYAFVSISAECEEEGGLSPAAIGFGAISVIELCAVAFLVHKIRRLKKKTAEAEAKTESTVEIGDDQQKQPDGSLKFIRFQKYCFKCFLCSHFT